MRFSCSSLLATLLGLLTLLILPAVASAQTMHAEYVSSDPAANAILTKAPSTISIVFSEELDPKSTIAVYDVDHQLVSQQGSAQLDRNDLKKMTVTLQANKSQVYVVDWNTVSADDKHQDAGSFRFFVNPDPMLTNELHANNPPGTNTGHTETASSSGGLPIWSAALIGVVALLVGGLVGFFFGGKRLQSK